MTQTHKHFIPAAGKHWALPFYDLMAKLLGADRARKALAGQAADGPAGRWLDIGCGTGSLLVLLKQSRRDAEVVGMDPDPGALALARRKAERAGLAIQLDQGFADALPYPDASFDRVFSSLMYHHLSKADKPRMLHEVRRVLKPGGLFHMMDLGGPASVKRGFLARHVHSGKHLKDNDEERVLAAMRDAGLTDARVAERVSVRVGDLACYRASAPAA
jgi:ubiquinone/menaquinone biosynthesis C-methylase UbiE